MRALPGEVSVSPLLEDFGGGGAHFCLHHDSEGRPEREPAGHSAVCALGVWRQAPVGEERLSCNLSRVVSEARPGGRVDAPVDGATGAVQLLERFVISAHQRDAASRVIWVLARTSVLGCEAEPVALVVHEGVAARRAGVVDSLR